MSPEGSSSERVLRWIPAAAALAVAALYSVGALLTAAGLRGAGLSVRDTLPLFSLEKLLARGISTLVGSILLLAALVLLGALVLSAGKRLGRPRSSRGATVGAVAGGTVLIAGLAFASPVLAAALLLALAVGIAAPSVAPAVSRPAVWALQYLVVLAGLIASAYVYPQPLPAARVEVTGDPAPIVGDLVTTTDFSWYVAGFETDLVRAIPAADIENAEFESRAREDPPQLKDLVTGLFD